MTDFWIPKLTIVENRGPAPCPGVGASGMFKIEGSLPDGRRRVIADWQPNLITDLGLERLASGSTLGYCAVGGGSTAPTVNDTALASYIATHSSVASDTNGTLSTSPYYGWRRKTFRFAAPGVNRNLAEIGVGWASGGASLWSRALIKNQAGDPITVSWLAAETLDVSYEMRWYPSLVDVPYEMVIAGQTHTGVVRASRVTYNQGVYDNFASAFTTSPGGQSNITGDLAVYTGAIGAVTASPSGTSGTVGVSSTNAYVGGSHKRSGTHIFGPTVANIGSVTAMRKENQVCTYQMSVSPAFIKSVDWTLTLNVETPTWGRYAPS